MKVDGFLDRFASFGNRDALIVDDRSYSYDRLIAEINRRDFREIPTTSVVALVGDFDLPTIASLFALWHRGCVVVPMLSSNEARCAIAEAEFVVQSGLSLPTGRISDHPLYADLQGPGLVLFTSGSTGVPKAALHEIERWTEKLFRPGRQNRTLAFLSFDHIGGLNTLLYALANGGCVICPDSRSPQTVWDAIGRHGVELLPTTPTFLRLSLLDGLKPNVPSLKLIAYGSEPMPEATLESMREQLPDVEFLQQFGMSELGVLRSRSREDGSTWVRLDGARVTDGLLEVKVQTAMLGYLNAPSPFTADGWLQTGDEAEQDGEYFRVLGRRSETINVGGEKVHPSEVEASLEALEGVVHAVVRGEANTLTGQVVVASVRLATNETMESFRTRMRSELKGKLPRHAVPQRVECLVGGVGERGKKLRAA